MTATESNRTYRLSDRYTNDSGTVFLTGFKRWLASRWNSSEPTGRRLNTAAFAAGYPGSPLGGPRRRAGAGRAGIG